MHFYSGSTELKLVLSSTDLKLGANFVNGNAEFNATMAQNGTSITVTLGGKVSPAGTLPTAGAGTMTWRPSAAATDLAGKPSATTTVTESGGSDQDF